MRDTDSAVRLGLIIAKEHMDALKRLRQKYEKETNGVVSISETIRLAILQADKGMKR